jgi:CheY-like chemotaxis protein
MAENRKQILFVDDDENFLTLLREIMAHHAGEEWEIHTVLDVGHALSILQEHPIDLLVIDVHMPVMDGIQFLGLLRRTYPNLLRVVLTGDASDTYRAACLNAGAELFLEKPVTEDGWQSLHTTLNALAKLRPTEGFRGVLRTVGLQDILQMECLARNSSILEITTPELQGRIFIEKGQIVHAEAGHRQGEEAFNQLLTLKGGDFNLHTFAEPAQRSVSGSWEFLLMEAARKRDEAAETQPVVERSQSVAAEPPPCPSRKEPSRTVKVAPAPVPSANEEDASLRPRIDEMLVASPQGDVLYEWQCRQATERIRFLEFVSQRAQQLGQGLPLGPFDRLEIESAQTRAITQIQADRTVFVSRTLVPVGPAS